MSFFIYLVKVVYKNYGGGKILKGNEFFRMEILKTGCLKFYELLIKVQI